VATATLDADLILPRRLAMRILAVAQNAQPQRIGGVVGDDGSGPVGFMSLRNSAATPETQVLHLPTDIAAAHLALRGRTLDLWAYVISHPAAAAEPSAEDFKSSAFPNALHLVISLSTKGVLEMRAWRLENGKPQEKVLKIRD